MSGIGLFGRARGLSIADFDGDGFPDVLISNQPDRGDGPFGSGGAYWLFHNDSIDMGNTNHWLTITVEGTVSNRDGIGTRLWLESPDGFTQMREITSGPTHGGGDFRAAYFGLGDNATGDLVIRWPNGAIQDVGTVTANQKLSYIEP